MPINILFLFHALCAASGLSGYAVFARWERNPSFAFYLASLAGLTGILAGLWYCLTLSGEAVFVWFALALMFCVGAQVHCWKNRSKWTHPPEFADAMLIYGGASAVVFGIVLAANAVLSRMPYSETLLSSLHAGIVEGLAALGFGPVVTMAIGDLSNYFRGIRH